MEKLHGHLLAALEVNVRLAVLAQRASLELPQRAWGWSPVFPALLGPGPIVPPALWGWRQHARTMGYLPPGDNHDIVEALRGCTPRSFYAAPDFLDTERDAEMIISALDRAVTRPERRHSGGRPW